MKKVILGLMIALGLIMISLNAEERVPAPSESQKEIDLVFAIDVSGSMENIIAATQKKVWTIVNEMLKPRPMPVVRVGLIAYRGENEECYGGTGFQVWDLIDDLDKVYEHLMALKTDNGECECVGRAVYEATHSMSWAKSPDALKVLFVLGNEPANQDTNQEKYGYKVTASGAIKQGIQVNTVYCAQSGEKVGPGWEEIARLADGVFTTIGLEGKVVEIPTPMDKELAELQGKLSETIVAFGGKEGEMMKEEQDKAQDAATKAPAGVQAARAGFLARQKSGRMGTWDLIDAIKEGRVKLEELKDEELPEEMQKMTLEERKTYLEKKQKEREELQKKITELAKARESYVQEEMKKQKSQDAFDQVILNTLREQAKKKGFKFEEEKGK